MNFSLTLATHAISLWFLVLSLFLPRICIVLAWVQHTMPHFIPASVGLVPVLAALIVPRILILFWIYQDQGITIWFLLHALALVLAWGGGGHRISRRRRVDLVD